MATRSQRCFSRLSTFMHAHEQARHHRSSPRSGDPCEVATGRSYRRCRPRSSTYGCGLLRLVDGAPAPPILRRQAICTAGVLRAEPPGGPVQCFIKTPTNGSPRYWFQDPGTPDSVAHIPCDLCEALPWWTAFSVSPETCHKPSRVNTVAAIAYTRSSP